jgi:hypothetical protein
MARPQAANEVFTSLSALSRYGQRVSAQRTQSAVSADHRSIIPNIPGVPWWAAVVVAVTGTAAGFAFDSGSGKELTTVFSALYVLGCVVAVLAVRQSGVFTAVIQPPLILFCAVPGAYWLFHRAKFTGLRDLLINCGYPLIERFPLMLFTSGGVLVIGITRWLLARVTRPVATAESSAAEADAAGSNAQLTGLAGRLVSMFAGLRRESADDDTAGKTAKAGSRRTHAVGRSAKPARSARSADSRRTGKRPAASRARHIRPPLDEAADPTLDRARRSRSQRPARPREFDGPEPPRRGRVPRDPDLRGRPSRETRRDPHGGKGRPARRSSRLDPYEPIEPYEPIGPTAPREPRRRPVPNGTSGATATHHPISQVRYRGSTRADDSRNEPTARPRRMREPAPDSWNYDIRDVRDA